MSRPVILVCAEDDDQRNALVDELIEKLGLMERGGDDVPLLKSTRDDFWSMKLSSLGSHA